MKCNALSDRHKVDKLAKNVDNSIKMCKSLYRSGTIEVDHMYKTNGYPHPCFYPHSLWTTYPHFPQPLQRDEVIHKKLG